MLYFDSNHAGNLNVEFTLTLQDSRPKFVACQKSNLLSRRRISGHVKWKSIEPNLVVTLKWIGRNWIRLKSGQIGTVSAHLESLFYEITITVAIATVSLLVTWKPAVIKIFFNLTFSFYIHYNLPTTVYGTNFILWWFILQACPVFSQDTWYKWNHHSQSQAAHTDIPFYNSSAKW